MAAMLSLAPMSATTGSQRLPRSRRQRTATPSMLGRPGDTTLEQVIIGKTMILLMHFRSLPDLQKHC